MKLFYLFSICLVIICCIPSCDILEDDTEEKTLENLDENSATTIQFYVDPQKFSQSPSGRFISSITINNINYPPKYFIDNCTEMYAVPATSNLNNSDVFFYKINMKNYDSLDAIMNGLPFSWEYWEGYIDLRDLKLGCNTLEVIESRGAQLFRLTVK